MSQDIKHFGALDFYRFVAAFSVLLLHFTEFAKYDQATGIGRAFFDFSLFVDFFFILSGFVIGASYFDRVDGPRKIFSFLRRRIARIYPLHALTLIIYLLPAIAGASQNAAKYDIGNIVAQALLVQSWPLNGTLPLNFPAWSISVEWGMYLLFPVLVIVTRSFGPLALVATVLLGFISIEIVLRLEFVNPPLWFANINLIRALPTFALGVLISRTYMRTIPLGSVLGLMAFAASFIAILVNASPYIAIAFFAATIFLTASGSGFQLFNDRISRTLGDASYGVYMLHSIVLTIMVQQIWPRLSISPPPLWFGFLCGAITTFAAMIVYKAFEKPAKDLISGTYRRTAMAGE
jgi:peptidoglycan/LPS O-acetylase OafA/YrhL